MTSTVFHNADVGPACLMGVNVLTKGREQTRDNVFHSAGRHVQPFVDPMALLALQSMAVSPSPSPTHPYSQLTASLGLQLLRADSRRRVSRGHVLHAPCLCLIFRDLYVDGRACLVCRGEQIEVTTGDGTDTSDLGSTTCPCWARRFLCRGSSGPPGISTRTEARPGSSASAGPSCKASTWRR